MPSLLAIADLHVDHPENARLLDELRPSNPGDWLIVAGDVASRVGRITSTMDLLSERFSKVLWVPGNHDLWTIPGDPVQLRGEARYRYLVELMRDRGVLTPEDPFPVWEGREGAVVIAPLFVLYDYSFRPHGVTQDEALRGAFDAGIVCTDEHLLHPDPYPSRESWSRARVEYSRFRLDAIDPALPTLLVNHYPLVEEPLEALRFPRFSLWCGTRSTRDWARRYRAIEVVYGHLHMPRTTCCDAVTHREVSLGYPHEWRRRGAPVLAHELLVDAPVAA